MNSTRDGGIATGRRAVPVVGAPREGWIDVAKGIAIVLVVLFHSALYLDLVGSAGRWGSVNNLLDTFRMPLFFTMSGVLAVGALSRGFGALWIRRVAPLLYLYALWSVLQILAAALAGAPFASANILRSIASIVVDPHPNLWFIYALPLYMTAHWLMRRWPVAVQVALAAAISASTPILLGVGVADGWAKPLRYIVFFTLGVHGAAIIRALAPRVRWWHASLAVIAYGLLIVGPVRWWSEGGTAVQLLVGLAAVVAGIAVAVSLDRLPGAAILRGLGRLTLPIYLLHVFPLLAAAALARLAGPLTGVAAECAPPLLAVFAIAVSVGVYRLSSSVPGLYALPSRARRREVSNASEFLTGRTPQT